MLFSLALLLSPLSIYSNEPDRHTSLQQYDGIKETRDIDEPELRQLASDKYATIYCPGPL